MNFIAIAMHAASLEAAAGHTPRHAFVQAHAAASGYLGGIGGTGATQGGTRTAA